MRDGRTSVGAWHVRVCEVEDTDRSPEDQISWWKVVRVPNRPFGQKTNLMSQHHQGFGIATRGLPRLWNGSSNDQTWEVGIRTVSRPLAIEGGDTRASWTPLDDEVWEGCWK